LRADAFPGRALDGSVKEITPAGDPVAKTFRIRIALPDDTPLHVGMSVEANIVSREKADALLVPAAAIVEDAVFVADGGRASRRKVEIGLRGSRFVEILSGVAEGDTVIAPASASIKDGQHIRPLSAEAAKP
jgi:multidrug efflux pump subunit AcrA (membrane-fusion protein)